MSLETFAQDVSQDVALRGLKRPPSISYDVAGSPATAPGWREIDTEYTCIPDPVYPWNPEVMKAIRGFAPDAVPLWVHWVFLSPGNKVVVFGRHALGRAVRNPGNELEPFRCAMPTMPCQGLTFERPNRIWFIHEGSPNPYHSDLPGTFLPFDGTILDRARRSSVGFRMTEKEFREATKAEFIEKERMRQDAQRAAREDEMEQRDKDFGAYAAKQFEKISDVETKEHMRRGTTLRQRRAR